MANDTISFFCQACGIKLTVPSNLAGVVGPCPSCRNQIQAPFPVVEAPAQPYGMPSGVLASARPPHVIATAPPSSGPVALKPEPRQLPVRSLPGEVVARPMPDASPTGIPHRPATGPHRRSHHFHRLSRILMLALFLTASGALVYGVLTVLKNQPAASEPPAPSSAVVKSPTPSTEQVPITQPPPPLPDGLDALEPISPWKDSEAVLEQFLEAGTLAERLPLIETKTPEAELAASCLAAALPPARKMVPEFRQSNPLESLVDCYYTVEFAPADQPAKAQTILVRTRGKNPPKVVVDPFLDMFGGRLAAYAAAPVEHAGVFQVVVYAVASCTDPNIPNREKKLTLKLLASDNTKEISRAYFGRQSKISEMLEDGTYSLSYGSAKTCTVMLRWNTEENPDYPFLEALAIKDLDWNS